MDNVIMLIPTYNRSRILEDCLSKLDKLKPQPSKYIFLENNSIDNTLEIIQNFNHPKEIIRFWFVKDATKRLDNHYGVIGIIRHYLLKKARQLNPDYAIFLDDDVLVYTEDFIKRITSNKKDIVGGPVLRNSSEGMWLSTVFWGKDEKGNMFKGRRKSCMGLHKVCWTSTGCLCLSRKIIQDKRVNFYPLMKDACEDFGYNIRASKLGYEVWLDCTIKLGHYQLSNKRPWSLKEGSETEYVDFEYE